MNSNGARANTATLTAVWSCGFHTLSATTDRLPSSVSEAICLTPAHHTVHLRRSSKITPSVYLVWFMATEVQSLRQGQCFIWKLIFHFPSLFLIRLCSLTLLFILSFFFYKTGIDEIFLLFLLILSVSVSSNTSIIYSFSVCIYIYIYIYTHTHTHIYIYI